jgi:NTE family protein
MARGSPVPGGRRALDAAARQLVERYFGLDLADAPALHPLLEPIEVAGGEWLFRQDSPGDAMYLLVRGRLRVWRDLPAEAGQEDVLLGEVAPGECVGEAGLMTGQDRSAGVRAIRDSLLVRVDRAAFALLAEHNAALVLRLAAVVAERMRMNMRPAAAGNRPPRTVAVLPLDDAPRTLGFAAALAEALRGDGEVVLLRRDALDRAEPGRRPLRADEPVDGVLRQGIADLEGDVRHLLFACDAANSPWTRFCLRQADLVLRVGEATGDAAPQDFELALDRELEQVGGSRHALVLLQPGGEDSIRDTLRWLEPRRVEYHLHLRADRPDDLARVARIVSGRAVGLVLGAGAARGFAHLGVYQAMRELGAPLDWIGGSSIGAIMAAAMAKDWPAARAIDVAHQSFVGGKPFSDYTLPLVSLLAGRRMRRLLRKHLPGTIEDLPLPFFCVSSNLTSGRSNLHVRGPLWQALASSAALPGVMPPTVHDGHLAIDGSVLNSLPVDVMQAMPVAKVIAVDLTTRKDYRLDYDRVPSAWQLLRSKFRGKAGRIRVPGLATLMLKSTEIGTVARVRELGARADLLLAPPVNRFSILDVSRFHDVVKAGYEEAMLRLPAWLAAPATAQDPTLSAAAAPAPRAEAVPSP